MLVSQKDERRKISKQLQEKIAQTLMVGGIKIVEQHRKRISYRSSTFTTPPASSVMPAYECRHQVKPVTIPDFCRPSRPELVPFQPWFDIWGEHLIAGFLPSAYARIMKQKKFLQKSNARLDIAAASLKRNQQINFAGSAREYFSSDSKL
jgi:hypothetical protein